MPRVQIDGVAGQAAPQRRARQQQRRPPQGQSAQRGFRPTTHPIVSLRQA